MEVGLTGQIGVPVVLHVAVDPNSVVALAPILLRLMVERNAVGTRTSLDSAMKILAPVSTTKNIQFFTINRYPTNARVYMNR